MASESLLDRIDRISRITLEQLSPDEYEKMRLPFMQSMLSMTTSVSDDMWIVTGFRQDCELLLYRFKNTGSLTFRAFAEVYRSLSFNHVFFGRQRLKEQLEFVEEALNIAKEFGYKDDDWSKVGSIYLMYCLYFNQPVKYFGKILFVKADVDRFRSLSDEFFQKKLIEPQFIFSKLIKQEAIRYTAAKTEMMPEMSKRRKFKIDKAPLANWIRIPSIKAFTENDSGYIDFEQSRTAYQEHKKEFQDLIKNDDKMTFNSVCQDDFCDDLHKVAAGKEIPKKDAWIGAACIGNRRKLLKNKAMTLREASVRTECNDTADDMDRDSFSETTMAETGQRKKVRQRKRAQTNGTVDPPLEEMQLIELPPLPRNAEFLAEQSNANDLWDPEESVVVHAKSRQKEKLEKKEKLCIPRKQKKRNVGEKKGRSPGRPKGSKNKKEINFEVGKEIKVEEMEHGLEQVAGCTKIKEEVHIPEVCYAKRRKISTNKVDSIYY